MRIYLRAIGRIPLLNAEQEVELGRRMGDGARADERLSSAEMIAADIKADLEWASEDGLLARKRLIDANLRLPVSLAKRYIGRGVAFLDLIQEGNLGLMTAVDKYEYARGNKFGTLATWWVRQAITRAIADQARTIRVPVHMVEQINKLDRVSREMKQKLGRDPTNEELATELDMAPAHVQEVKDHAREPVSIHRLEDPSDETGRELVDKLPDQGERDPTGDRALRPSTDELSDVVAEVLAEALNERELNVIRGRFGLNTGDREPLVQRTIAENLGLSRPGVGRIEKRALGKLVALANQNSSAMKLLRGYYEALKL